MSRARLRVTAPTRPARDALLGYLTGLEDEPRLLWAEARFAAPLAELRADCGESVAIAFEDGGLLQSLDAWHNALLPVAFHAAHEVEVATWRARGILAALGRDAQQFTGRYQAELSMFERRLIGFVKAMLLEPQLLVLDRLFEELGYEEQQGVSAFLQLFRSRYPLRRMLYVGLTETAPGLLAGFEPLETMEEVQ